MPLIHWQECYATGIQIIDDQHRQLFQTINQLFDQIQTGADLQEVVETLDFLTAYAVNHFQTEESFMAESGYPNLADHLHEHRILMGKLQDVRHRFTTSEAPNTVELSRIVNDWMSHHLSEVDMGYASYLRLGSGL